ncbi:MAG: FAD-dependent oxidoreductase [Acetobacteraceae bacterium]|nr:FAD-dependent oxidoreductase [Acetobacteraceae bacterium]
MSFDAVVIGGGISGASSAQHLAAEGYRVLLVEKDDFASAATSRSGRLLHNGLRYLAPAYSPWEFLRHPGRLATALRVACQSSRTSDEFVATTPERARRMRLCFPIFKDSPFPGWQVGIGATILNLLGRRRLPLAYERHAPAAAAKLPFAKWLREPDTLDSIVQFDDYQFFWPERICMDCILDAERLGACARNYTSAIALRRSGERWLVTLRDELDGTAAEATVSAPVLLNMAGAWIDRVNGTATGASRPSRKIVAVKGVHILVQLPEECRDQGFLGINRDKEGIACFPWGGMHFVGPTETVYDGDIDDVRPLKQDIDYILDEINYLLPGIRLAPADVCHAWAGVRPITYDPALPKGRRMPFSVLHDLGAEGMPNVLSVTWAAIMFHRDSARQVVAAVRSRFPPSLPAKPIDYSARHFPENQNSPPLVHARPEIKVADIAHATRSEQAVSLVDVLYRRTGLGWNTAIPVESIRAAAQAMAGVLGWDQARTEAEIAAFDTYVTTYHHAPNRAWQA